jgi:hypothetical protein
LSIVLVFVCFLRLKLIALLASVDLLSFINLKPILMCA